MKSSLSSTYESWNKQAGWTEGTIFGRRAHICMLYRILLILPPACPLALHPRLQDDLFEILSVLQLLKIVFVIGWGVYTSCRKYAKWLNFAWGIHINKHFLVSAWTKITTAWSIVVVWKEGSACYGRLGF